MPGKCILILGGARSGKSSFAERLASKHGGSVLYVATAEAGDEEMRRRIEEHRRARPVSWRSLEAPRALGATIQKEAKDARVIIVDCLTLLVSNLMAGMEEPSPEELTQVEKDLEAEVEELLMTMDSSDAKFVIVSNEVGMGLVPPYAMGRVYRDLLGRANQRLARRADEVYLMVAGIPVDVKALGRALL